MLWTVVSRLWNSCPFLLVFGVGISIGSLQGLEVGGESFRLEESRTFVLACLGLFVAPLLRVWLYCLVVDGIFGCQKAWVVGLGFSSGW